VWKLVEGSCALLGISFNGFDDNGQPEWNGLANVESVSRNKSKVEMLALMFIPIILIIIFKPVICFSKNSCALNLRLL